ncbi:autotransporter outer membrane beta-barrel domain-containing protein [Citrobacter sp. FDAARGOS_156]|nr:autotransporter outer membrane beta-barrel domain-containing protein [Citrobacter sp. FDAARGOS_156]
MGIAETMFSLNKLTKCIILSTSTLAISGAFTSALASSPCRTNADGISQTCTTVTNVEEGNPDNIDNGITTSTGNDIVNLVHQSRVYGSGISTGDGNDTITLDDTYVFGSTSDGYAVDAGAGNDTITLNNYKDGYSNDDAIYEGGDGNDIISINNVHDDDINSKTGKAALQPSLDGATFDGGNGNDTISVKNDTDHFLMSFNVNGGDGDDYIALGSDDASSPLKVEVATINGGAGSDTIELNNTVCVMGCYIDGGVNENSTDTNKLVLNNSHVSAGVPLTMITDDTDDNGNPTYGTATFNGEINNINEFDITHKSSLVVMDGTNDSGTGNSSGLDYGADPDNNSFASADTINVTDNSKLLVGGDNNYFVDGTDVNVESNSVLIVSGAAANSLTNANVNTSADSYLVIGGKTNDPVNVTLSELGNTGSQGGVIYSTDNSNNINVAFANGQQSVTARSGAYNYDATIDSTTNTDKTIASQNLTADAATTTTASVTMAKAGLASDVQGAIAGLDAAKQSSDVIASDIAAHMDSINNINLRYGVQEGAHIWGDFLYQNGNYQDDVNYKSVLQGTQGGMDWTTELGNTDSLTGGIALGYIRNKTSHGDNSGHFNNDVYGNYYSVYGGWQQHLHETGWGLFADGSFSYGDMRYSMSGSNVGTQTTGNQQSYSSSYQGNAYNVESRAGVNMMLPSQTLVQTYALAGWDKATSDGFSESGIEYSDNNISVWHAGAGVRVTTEVDVANISLMPWADARYQAEFSDNSDFTAADYHMSEGNNQKLGIFGLGVNAGLNKDLTFNVSTYYGTGDIDSDVSVQAGLNYHF